MASAVSQLTSLTRLRLRRPLLHFGGDQYTLYVSIGVMFSILMATLGVVLITYNFEKSKATALLAASQLFDHVAQQTAMSLSELYVPAETLVDLTAQLSIAHAQPLEERLPLVKYFAESLRVNEHLSAAYIGYANGAFFLVRAVSDHSAARLSLAAPDNTAFAVQSIEREADGTARYENLYFDDSLRRVGNETRLNTGFDPRIRGWYQAAVRTPDRITTDFYVFFTTHEIGATVARRLPDGGGVIGADLTVRSLSAVVNSHSVTPSTEIIVFDDEGNVLAYRDPDRLVRKSGEGSRTTVRRAHITDIGSPIIDDLFRAFVGGARDEQLDLQRAGEHWFGSVTPLSFGADKQVYLSILVPELELLADIERTRFRSVILSIAFLVVAIVMVWWTSRQISRPVQALAREADHIRQLQLDTPIVVRSRISEVAELTAAMTMMKAAIKRFVEIGKALSAEKDLGRLLEMILREAEVACRAEWGSVLLVSQDKTTLDTMFIRRSSSDGSPSGSCGRGLYPAIPLYDAAGAACTNSIEASVVHTGETINVDNIAAENRFDFQDFRQPGDSATVYMCRSLLAVPLKNHQGKVIGVLELANPRDPQTGTLQNFHAEVITIVESLAATAAVAIEKQRLLEKQQDWLAELEKQVAERTGELEEANEQLRGLDKLKSMFIASMSHEVGSPLTAIVGFTDLLLGEASGPLTDSQREELNRIRTASEHLQGIMTKVINISKIEAGFAEVKTEDVELDELVDEALDIVRGDARKKGLALDRVIAGGAIRLQTDRSKLLQCLINLLSNAVKYTEWGSVKLVAKAIGDVVEISVQDTGIGISPDELDRIFKAFERIDSPLRSKSPGTGLGLYLTRKIVRELLGGEIRVSSQPGRGSLFTLQVPMTAEMSTTLGTAPAASGL